jgi:phospholipid-translocating ATPase
MPEYREDGLFIYQAQSPDEGALVKAARSFGFVFKSRTPDSITIYDATIDEDVIYELLQILDFDNNRKRMSVVVRKVSANGERGPITVYCKGADTMVMDRLREPEDEDFEIRHKTKGRYL